MKVQGSSCCAEKTTEKAAQNCRLELVEDLLEGSDTEQRIDIVTSETEQRIDIAHQAKIGGHMGIQI